MTTGERAERASVVDPRPVSVVAGRPLSDPGGPERKILDPARATVLAHVRDAEPRDVDAAVAAARRVHEGGAWSTLPREERGAALEAIAARLRAHHEELALLDSLNVGKPISQARDDAALAADFFAHAGRVIATLADEVLRSDAEQLSVVVREPVGVVAAITPWNFPVAIAASVLAPALAAGNSVVHKPSPETPLSALRIAELTADLLPEGVLSVVSGGRTVGRALSAHGEVDRVVFTGSAEAGREIMRTAAASFKRLGLELGGKSPTVVFDDAPFDAAVASALARVALNQGENCSAGTRLLVQKTIYDRFVGALVQAAERLTIGDPQEESIDLGPLISGRHLERVRDHVVSAEREARALHVGPVPCEPPLADGFFAPLSIWEAGPGTRLWRDEVFGPMLAVVPFSDEDDAVRLANDTPYGLMAVIWCGDRARGVRVGQRVRAGVIRINGAGMPLGAPWGGFKASGIGRGYGRYGIDASSELKQINVDLT